MTLHHLSDDALLSSLHGISLDARRLDARVVMHLVEVEERRLHLKAACSSLFDFCVRRLHMSEGAAFRRINAARLVRKLPRLADHIERGGVHLSTLVLLRDVLTADNVDEIIASSSGRTKREVEELVARLAPRPDAPPSLRKLPAARPSAPAPLFEDGAKPNAPPHPSGQPSARLEPLSESRHKLQLTITGAQRDKLERARDLLRHRNPSGDLSVVVDQALDLLVAKLEKERLGKVTKPRPLACATKKGRIATAVRREVFARDGEQCTYVDEHGRRCGAQTLLEIDHVHSRALGGADDAANLRVRCRAHNRLHAEEVFGQKSVERGIHFRQRKSELDAAIRGLVKMGFREPDARRAVDAIAGRDEPPRPIPEVLREALAVLTCRRGATSSSG